jgi:acyl-CoA synthetase (AMP-forming)/AMP-acid ligase II
LLSATQSLETAIAAAGILRAGLVLVPVNPLLTGRELRHVIAETAPKACVAGSDQALRSMLDIDPAMLPLQSTPLQTTERPQVGGFHGLDQAEPSDPAVILFTSGTTGVPKGAAHSHASLLANTDALASAWRWTPDDRLLHALPLFHAHGLCVGLLATLGIGASAVLLPRFDAESVAETIEAHGATMFFGVPTMYHRLAESGVASALSRLRLAVSGSAPLPAALHNAIAEAGGGSVLERYGTTETLMNLSNPYEGERRPGSVGLPLPGVSVRLAPRVVGDGTTGEGDRELLVSGPTLFTGYWGRPEATAEAVVDGWYATGDIASMDCDGYVRILGRTKELVISGGYNVYPAEVEAVLAGHPGVAEVAVAGTPSAEWGEVVTAYVVPAGATGELEVALRTYASERLAPYKCPRIIHFIDSIPKNAMGKVVRSQLPSRLG